MERCLWASNNPLLQEYHDKEWGRIVKDDNKLFEMLILDCHQAGLSWLTILKKKEGYQQAFSQFNPHIVATYTDSDIEALMQNPAIIRNRLKLKATVNNAKAFLKIKQEFGSFSNYLWGFVDHKPVINEWRDHTCIPTRTPLSDIISKDLYQRGFRFVGSVIIYSFLQAAGIVFDHTTNCFLYQELLKQNEFETK